MALATETGEVSAIMLWRIKNTGFTLVELLVVMAVIALLLSIAMPRYFSSVEKTREAVLRENLSITRQALDKYFGDNGKYPETLEQLVSGKYLRSLPQDPITDSSSTWIIVPPDVAEKGGVFDLKSGATGNARDGTEYKEW
jgi:general secretion pathway protein G